MIFKWVSDHDSALWISIELQHHSHSVLFRCLCQLIFTRAACSSTATTNLSSLLVTYLCLDNVCSLSLTHSVSLTKCFVLWLNVRPGPLWCEHRVRCPALLFLSRAWRRMKMTPLHRLLSLRESEALYNAPADNIDDWQQKRRWSG